MILILQSFFGRPVRRYFLRLFFVGSLLRLVLAKSRNCFSLIDCTICFDAPLSDDFDRFPRLAASAAPAAICCFFDLAGIMKTRLYFAAAIFLDFAAGLLKFGDIFFMVQKNRTHAGAWMFEKMFKRAGQAMPRAP